MPVIGCQPDRARSRRRSNRNGEGRERDAGSGASELVRQGACMVANEFLIRAAKAAAGAGGARYGDAVDIYHRFAQAVIAEGANPSPAMIDAAYEAVRFDEHWAINSRRDFQTAVKAMVRHARR